MIRQQLDILSDAHQPFPQPDLMLFRKLKVDDLWGHDCWRYEAEVGVSATFQ
jgi:hypothetical protein